MTTVAVLIPVLGRPERVKPLLETLTDEPRAHPVFICSPRDDEEHAAIGSAIHDLLAARDHSLDRAWIMPDGMTSIRMPPSLPWGKATGVIVPWDPGPGDYARKINEGYRKTDDPWILCGADDLRFHPGWLDAALKVAEATGCGVIGTNDLGNPSVVKGTHATHPLIARWYVEECGASADGPGVIYHEGYDHQFCDTELIGVAKSRDCFAPAHDSVVEHLHPFWHKGADDPTYEKGRRGAAEDQRLFNERRKLWA